MIEEILAEHLPECLGGVPVTFERPPDFTPPAVVIERTGEILEDHLSTVTVAADCYGNSLLEAAKLCDRLTDAVLGLPDSSDVGASWITTSYNNSVGKNYSYKAIYKLTYRR